MAKCAHKGYRNFKRPFSITRPAIANERLSVNRAGQVVLKLKTAWRDGTSHHVMTPMEFMQRLAALVPRPRLHLIRFHGVLAPNAKLRKAVVPVSPLAVANTADAGDGAYLLAGSAKGRMRWAQLLKRVFDIDIEQCPHCGGQLKLIAEFYGVRLALNFRQPRPPHFSDAQRRQHQSHSQLFRRRRRQPPHLPRNGGHPKQVLQPRFDKLTTNGINCNTRCCAD